MIIICIRYVNKYVSFVPFFFLDVQILLRVSINFILLLFNSSILLINPVKKVLLRSRFFLQEFCEMK